MPLPLLTLAVLAVAFTLAWALSVRLRDASIADLHWAPSFALTALVVLLRVGGGDARALLVLALTLAWAVRLTVHLARRNLGHGEDFRYAAMRRHHGDRFWIVSLGTVFGLQGLLSWVVSAPVQAVALGAGAPLGPLDAAGAAAALLGIALEGIADLQLTRFRADPASKGRVMDQGLWRYSRHPNYFGNAVLWWGLFLPALSIGAWWAAIGPLVMTLLLLKVSGVALLEKTIVERRPGYAEYVRRTSAFVPWWPRGAP